MKPIFVERTKRNAVSDKIMWALQIFKAYKKGTLADEILWTLIGGLFCGIVGSIAWVYCAMIAEVLR
jgi:hypothetical protein